MFEAVIIIGIVIAVVGLIMFGVDPEAPVGGLGLGIACCAVVMMLVFLVLYNEEQENHKRELINAGIIKFTEQGKSYTSKEYVNILPYRIKVDSVLTN